VAAQGGPEPGATHDEVALVRARKAALRGAIRLARDGLTAAERAVASAAAEERLWRLPVFRTTRTVALYAAHRGEVDLTGLVDRCRDQGVRTAFPRVTGDDLELVATVAGSAHVPGYLGIREPTGPPIDLDEVDVVVLPGVAFDPNGGRLGQGGGHYDRLLADLPARAVRVGVGFACQLVPNVPREAHDAPLDVVVTDRGTYRTDAREPGGV
jgi:5-formyltetrahydrofolate cyclo-ligase